MSVSLDGRIAINGGLPAATAGDVASAAIGSFMSDGSVTGPSPVSQAEEIDDGAASLVLASGSDSGPFHKRPMS